METGAYPYEIGRRAPSVLVVQQACPALVAEIEAGAGSSTIQPLIDGYTAELLARSADGRLDSVVLGCTHYPLVADAFASALPDGLPILQQSKIVAGSLTAYLARHPEFDDRSESGGGVRFLTTRADDASNAVASLFFGQPVSFAPVA